ncbi:MAG: 1-acyl-sn-glycerol-3-phosphate acyltransferase [Bacteroidales bacterium]|nr:1-acyl-sn-glycerol-3-phosphate acyltransferase [Bacteroidales bacterium]
MKYLVSIYMWIIGGLSYFLIFTLVILLSPFLSKKALYKVQNTLGKVALWLMFFRVKINYEEKLDKKSAYIFMPNHVSMLDVLVLAAHNPIYANAIEAKSHFKWFYYGWVIRILEQIPINRKSAKESLKSFEIAKKRIKKGRSIIVFPEGTRSGDGKLGKFKKLPFKFANETKATIVPIGITGVDQANPEKSIWVKPARITVNFGKPISKEEVEKMSIEELLDETHDRVEKLLEK